MLDFPNLVPSSRSFKSGDYPVSRYKAINGMEVRVLRGSNQTSMELALRYNAIKDTEVELFLNHFSQQKGTYEKFILIGTDGSRDTVGAKGGWAGDPGSLGAVGQGNEWRYAGPVEVTSVYPGVSNVSVQLVAVLRAS